MFRGDNIMHQEVAFLLSVICRTMHTESGSCDSSCEVVVSRTIIQLGQVSLARCRRNYMLLAWFVEPRPRLGITTTRRTFGAQPG